MPFRYFGGKKALARHYPSPLFNRIIEPFAGSAGYSLHWATPDTDVILVEADGRVADLWRRLQRMSLDELMSIECPPLGSRCDEPLINLSAASENTLRSRRFSDSQVTGRMVEKWPGARASIARKLDLIRSWRVIHGRYEKIDVLRLGGVSATWHVDPPYAPRQGESRGSRGGGYGPGCTSRDIDYAHLGRWCRTLPGQVMVCEQADATWLPFQPFRSIRTTSTAGSTMMAHEGLWLGGDR